MILTGPDSDESSHHRKADRHALHCDRQSSPQKRHLYVLHIIQCIVLLLGCVSCLNLSVHTQHQLARLIRPVVASFVTEAARHLNEAERIQQLSDSA